MMNENMDLELEVLELNDDELEMVSGGKKGSLYVKCKGKKVNVRSGPGTEYRSIALMQNGDELGYLGEKKKDKAGKTWLKVECVSMVGWVRSDLVKK